LVTGYAVHREEAASRPETQFTPSQHDGFVLYLTRVTVEGGSMPAVDVGGGFGHRLITSMPLLWQMLARPAGNAGSVTKSGSG